MPIPIQKVLLTATRFLMRPINNTITKTLKTKEKDTIGYIFFERFGQKVNIFEVKMNRTLLRSKGLGEIKELSKDVSFNKGIEWFTEVFIFYGILLLIAAFEIRKAQASSKKTKELITQLSAESVVQDEMLENLQVKLVQAR